MRREQPPRQRDMREITECAICGKRLSYPRLHVDTCGPRCYKKQLDRHRAMYAAQVKKEDRYARRH